MSSHPAPTTSPSTPETVTAIGVDLGVKRLVVAAPADAAPDVPNALVVGESVERDLYNALGDTLSRLAELPADTTEAEGQAVETYRSLLHQRFVLATRSLVEYADRHDADVVALEDIGYQDGTLAECARGRTKAGEWVLPAFRDFLEETLAAEGFRVECVDATNSTQRCHVCGELADLTRATITCEADGCPVDAICRDRSAAVTLANRVSGKKC